MGKKVISFSIYGDDPMYQVGAIKNMALQKQFFPDWICRFYVSQEIGPELIRQLQEGGAEIVQKQRKHLADGSLWRFLPAADPEVDVLIVRDTDSRLSFREKVAVDTWLQSKKTFHIIRDHPFHYEPILAGLWGCRKPILTEMAWLIERWTKFDDKWDDQRFLATRIYPRVRHDVLIHSEFIQFAGETTERIPFPRAGTEFIGCPFRADDRLRTDRSVTAQLLAQELQILPMPAYIVSVKGKLRRRLEAIAFYAHQRFPYRKWNAATSS